MRSDLVFGVSKAGHPFSGYVLGVVPKQTFDAKRLFVFLSIGSSAVRPGWFLTVSVTSKNFSVMLKIY